MWEKTKKAAVTKEELEKSGLSLRDALNKLEGKTRRKDMKKGGAVKKTTKAKASKPKFVVRVSLEKVSVPVNGVMSVRSVPERVFLVLENLFFR